MHCFCHLSLVESACQRAFCQFFESVVWLLVSGHLFGPGFAWKVNENPNAQPDETASLFNARMLLPPGNALRCCYKTSGGRGV